MIDLIKVKTGATRYSYVHRANESDPNTTKVYTEAQAVDMESKSEAKLIEYTDSYLFTEKKSHYEQSGMVLDDNYDLNE